MPHEEAIVISPLDETMEKELVKANVTDAVIATLKDKYGSLRLRSVDDKETYLEIKDAKKDCAKLRNLAVKVCKEGREQAVAIQKKWVSKEKEVVGKIAEVENSLDAEIDTFDAEVKRKELEEKQRQETQYMQRTQALTKMGAMYSDNSFVLGEFSLEANLVKESSQEVWDEEILPKFNEQFFILEAERIEQEKVKAEKEAELKRQQEELLQKQREFEQQQAEFKRQQEEATKAEMERMQEEARKKQEANNLKLKERLSFLSGWGYNGFTVSSHGKIFGSKEDLLLMSDEDFKALVKQNEFYIIEEAKVREQEAQEQIKKAEEAAAQKERERIAEEQRQAEAKRQAEEQKKAEELAKAGDKAIWADFIAKLATVQVPSLKSRQYKHMATQANEKIGQINALKPQ
jgi:unconventional prefoldin RPB5 interactor 1